MPPTTEKPVLPSQLYLRRSDVQRVVGGWRKLSALMSLGKLRTVKLPGYKKGHFVRAEVQAVLDEAYGK